MNLLKKRNTVYVAIPILVMLFFACNQSRGNRKSVAEDVPIGGVLSVKKNVLQEKDTTIGCFRVHYKLLELLDDIIVKKGTLSTGEDVLSKYYNGIVELNLKYKEKDIFTKTIRKEDFISIIPKDILNEYQIWNFVIEEVLDDHITFSLNICVPDTDDCYCLLYSVSSMGEFNISQEVVEWEEE